MSKTATSATEKPEPSSEPRRNDSPSRVRRVLKWTLRTLVVLLGLVVLAGLGAGLWVRSQLAASLPQLAGEHVVRGLEGPVVIERDGLGVVTIRGSSRRDVALATGFAHAQDRFFQMDLMRRQAAGELAELAGAGLLRVDRRLRVHRFRPLAQRLLAHMEVGRRSLLETYAAGVNEGLAALGDAPPEYWVLGSEPAPWKPEDSLLVVLGMFLLLQDAEAEYESMLGLMQDLLPAPLFEFLTPPGTEWDTPLVGGPLASSPIPGPELFDLRPESASGERMPAAERWQPEATAASNAWAVAGSNTAFGGALLAVDMHLGLAVPNTWYRASFVWPAESASGEQHTVSGITLPGAPLMVVGSNTHVAWGFTNSRIDSTDVVRIEIDPEDDGAYLTPEGPIPFERHQEILRIKGGEQESLEVVSTIWGPVLKEDHAGRRCAVRWIPQVEGAVNLDLVLMETASDVDEALAIAHRSGIPAQNMVLVDSTGQIAWTIAGKIPRRVGFDGRLPSSWADGAHRWEGWLDPDEIPRGVAPESGRLWSANQRMVGGESLERLGAPDYVLGARARQIRDRLLALEAASFADMLEIQLDDRALFLERWREILLRILTPEAIAADPRRGEFRAFVDDWGGRASVDSVGYRLVREYRELLAQQVFASLTAACKEADPDFDYFDEFKLAEGPLWTLITERPVHLLNPRFRSWEEQLLAVVDAISDQAEEEEVPLAERTWGQRNTSSIRHLFSRALPVVGRWVDMPAQELPGDGFMPRTQRPSYGASQRMVVSPGREQDSFFHMPCGQSGHPLSPHYRDSHPAWARGEPTPFLPGESVNILTLLPRD